MTGAWVRPGGPLFPDQEKGRRIGLQQFFWDATDKGIDPRTNGGTDVLELMRKAGWKVGITRDPTWDGYNITPEAWGLKLSDDLTRLGCDRKQCSVIADIEVHDSDWILRALKSFRAKRPNRYLYWTMEPFQGGIISVTLVAWINADPNCWVVPQKYRGDMRPVSENACIEDLMLRFI